jgi:hypothetical protein
MTRMAIDDTQSPLSAHRRNTVATQMAAGRCGIVMEAAGFCCVADV